MTSVNGRLKRRIKILHVLAMEGPLNPYKVWNKLVKEEAATQPTIRGDLEEMLKEVPPLVKTVDTDQKARGGRPSDYYDLDFHGLSTLIVYFENLGDRAGDPHQFARHAAEKYRDLLPSIFNLWPEFIKENAEESAWRALKLASGDYAELTPANFVSGNPQFDAFGEKHPIGSSDYTTHLFLAGIRGDLTWADSLDHEAWLQVVARNQTIRDALVGFTLDDLSERIEWANDVLRLLPDKSCHISAFPRRPLVVFLLAVGRVDVNSTPDLDLAEAEYATGS